MNQFLEDDLYKKIITVLGTYQFDGLNQHNAANDLIEVVKYGHEKMQDVSDIRIEAVKLAKMFLPEATSYKSILEYADKFADFMTYGTIPK